ncbi:DUF983 domain-containing protein [Halocola ammonii]
MLKGTKLYSIFRFKCAKCHRGNLYQHPNPYKLNTLTKMNKECACCGEKFTKEPGFFFGAAYVSYALTVALWVALWVALAVFDALGWISFSFFEDPLLFLGLGVALLIITLPYFYRLSRSIWINFFTNFDKETAERVKDCDPKS